MERGKKLSIKVSSFSNRLKPITHYAMQICRTFDGIKENEKYLDYVLDWFWNTPSNYEVWTMMTQFKSIFDSDIYHFLIFLTASKFEYKEIKKNMYECREKYISKSISKYRK